LTDWTLAGGYGSLRMRGSSDEAARGVVNLVNMQGAGRIGVRPTGRFPEVASAVKRLDPRSTWRDWWASTSGEPVAVSGSCPARRQTPYFPWRRPDHARGRCLGVNFGGSYLRLVWLVNGSVDGEELLSLSADEGPLARGSRVRDLVALLTGPKRSRDLQCIGIAWSAVRTPSGLRSTALQAADGGRIAELLDRGALDAVLTKGCGVRVRSWPDGEAAAAAEAGARNQVGRRSLLVLKLGTSFASGLVTEFGICGLPLQLAKCLLAVRPAREYRHPSVGFPGTARDLLGARSIERSYGAASGIRDATYADFCQAVSLSSSVAVDIARRSAAAIAELTDLVGSIGGPVDLVLTGKNIEDQGFRDFLYRQTDQLLGEGPGGTQRFDPSWDVDIAAAAGAVSLSLASP
jgi:predicted NBD/HSP70 family sugar kinase